MILPAAPISKRKHQQRGNGANQKLGHIIQPKTLVRRAARLEMLYVDQARTAEIGVSPVYRHSNHGMPMPTVEFWNATAKQWDVDHDVVRKPKPTNKKSRTRRSKARPATTYRAARRNADNTKQPARVAARPTHSWPIQPFRRGSYQQHDLSGLCHADLQAIQQAEARRSRRNAKRAA